MSPKNLVRVIQGCVLYTGKYGNYDDLKRLQSGIVIGMECNRDKVIKQKCVVCCEGKQTRLAFPAKGSRAREVFMVTFVVQWNKN